MFRSALRLKLVVLAVLVVAQSALAQPAAGGPTYIQLILDASGSMFNKLEDGRYRIVAAKDVLTQLISSLPEDAGLNVGLRVYGAGRWASDPDACEDTHLLVPMDGVDRSQLLQTVRDTQAQGATPIALSLELAAQDFPADGRKVIVLITDGIESCRTDLREVAEHLRSQGFDIDLRIIGIDLDDFARQAFEGLGTFENATSATELLSALNRAIEVEPAEATHTVTVTLTREGAPATDGAGVEFVGSVDETVHAFPESDDGEFTAQLPAGAYTAVVQDAYSAEPTTVSGITVSEGVNEFAFELAPPVEVTLTVSDDQPAAGSTIVATFDGAPEGRGQVWLSPADAAVGLTWEYVDGPAGEVELRVPDEPGTYEVVYHLELPEGGTKQIGSTPIEAQPVTASVSAAPQAVAGSAVEITWEGPDNAGDYVTIVPAGASEGEFGDYAYSRDGSPLSVKAPEQPGNYEIWYVTGQSNRTLASTTLEVTAASATVTAPETAEGGATVEIHWTGPDNDGDYITIVPAGADDGSYEDYAYTRDGSPVSVRVPGEAGDYEARYVTAGESRTLASAPITVTAASGSIDAPASVLAGADVEIGWTGPDNDGDFITIVPAGSDEGTWENYAYTRDGDPVVVAAPEDAGDYEIRYVTGSEYRTLAHAPLTVEPATATVSGPTEAAVSETIEVSWTGPGNSGDFITVVLATDSDDTWGGSYAYVDDGNPVSITVPDEPGDYEIRYVTGQRYYTLARQPLTIR